MPRPTGSFPPQPPFSPTGRFPPQAPQAPKAPKAPKAPQPPKPPQTPEPPLEDPIERTMQLDAPEFAEVMDSAETEAVERTMQLDAPDFGRPQLQEDAAERTMEMAPPSFEPLEDSSDIDAPGPDPLERTMQYDEPDIPEDELQQTIVVPPPSLDDPNAVTMPMQPLTPAGGGEADNDATMFVPTPGAPPPGSGAHGLDELDLNAQTLPIQALDPNDVTLPLGTTPAGADRGELSYDELELDLNAQTLPISKPNLPPASGAIPPIGPSSGVIPPRPSTGSGVIGNPNAPDLDHTGAEAQPDLTGQLVGNRYQIVSKLGQGGMGTVYKAEHTLMGRTVAIKVLNRDLVRSEESVARFKREIKTMAQFQHPNVVRLFDAGTTSGGNLYMAMEYVEGVNLAQILAREQRLALDRFASFFAQMLLGVAMGHARGIVHRDLKTENILICTPKPGQEQVKIMDFGIAKLLGGDEGETALKQKNVFLTTERVAIGTPEYMSPEQASGGANVDLRSDLYSLGVVGFELLTGRLPFDADSPVGFIGKHILEPPLTFEEAHPGLGLPPAVEAFVQKALEKDPADRYPSAEAMLDALEEAVPPDLRVMVSQVRVKSLGSSQAGDGLTYSQARKGAPPSSTVQVGGAAPPEAEKRAQLARALKVTIGVLGLLLLLVVGLLVRRALAPGSVEDRLAKVLPQVEAAYEKRDWDEAKKPLNTLLSDLDEDQREPVAAKLKEIERAEAAVDAFAANEEKLTKAAETFARAWDQEKLSAAEQAYAALSEHHQRDTKLRAELKRLKLEDVASKAAAPPDLKAIENQLEVLRTIDRAGALVSTENPEYRSAINQLEGALKRVDAKSAVAGRLRKLRDEAQVGDLLQQAKRKVGDGGDPVQLEEATAILSKARRVVRDRSLKPELSERIDEVERQIAAKQKTAEQQAREGEVRGFIAKAKLHEARAAYADAEAALKKAKALVDRHSLPGVWNLKSEIARLEGLAASLAAFKALPALPKASASLDAFQAALAARQRYLKDHPKGHAWETVEGEVKTLTASIASRRDAARAEEFRGQLAKARQALSKGDAANARALAEEAVRLAQRHGIDPAPAQKLVDEIRAQQRAARVKQRLKDFAKVGDVYMGKYEVTNLDYLKFCLATAKEPGGLEKVKALWPDGWRKAVSAEKPWARMFPSGTALHPVGGVSFQDAQAYCAWRSKTWGVKVRLPTREEWIAAASSGFDKRTYPWGPTWNPSRAVFQRTHTEDARGARAKRWEIGATKQGILHMAGNVAEWTSDVWIHPETGKDPSARVLMGGSYRSFRKEMLQVRYKGERGGLTERKPQWGFRVVIDPR